MLFCLKDDKVSMSPGSVLILVTDPDSMLVEGNILENYLGYKGCGLIGPSLPEAPIRGDYLNLEKLIF